MEELSIDILREVLARCKINWIILLSETSLRMNHFVSIALNIFAPGGRIWWERKLANDFNTGDIEYLLPEQREPNELYFFLAAPRDVVAEYGAERGVEWMIESISFNKRQIGHYLNKEGKHPWIVHGSNLREFIQMSDSEHEAIREEAGFLELSELVELIRIGRVDLAFGHVASRLMGSDSGEVIASALADIADVYDQTGDKRILELIDEAMNSHRYHVSTSGPLISKVSARNSPAVVGAVLKGMKTVTDKKSGTTVDRKLGIEHDGGLPLLNAVNRQSEEIVRLLLEEGGAKPNKAFRRAVQLKNYSIMKLLSDRKDFKDARVTKKEALALTGSARELLDTLVASGKVTLT